jgi:alpha-beta hydrolase superfamily lysophospholipase
MEKKEEHKLPSFDGITITETVFTNNRKLEIYTLSWVPKNPKAVLFFIHGLGEHINRYHNVSRHFADLGFAVYALDHEGHGRSKGLKKEYFDRFSGLVDDIFQLIDENVTKHPELPVFALGHSMGGTLVMQCVYKRPNYFRSVVLSGPAIGLPPDVSSFLYKVSKPISAMFPSLGIQPLDVTTLCSDKELVKEYLEDPLVWKGKVRARVGTELLNAAVYNLEHAKDFRTPFLLCQGQKDLIVDHTKAQVFFDKCGEEDKQIIYFKESMHEILFDVENQAVKDIMGKWLVEHADKSRPEGEKLIPEPAHKK